MPFTNYLQGKLLGVMLQGTAYGPLTDVYAALSTTTPAEGGTGFAEPSGNAYARVAVACNTTNWPAPSASASGSTISNGTAITFPQATGSWGTVTYVGLYDAATAGNLIGYGAMTTAQTIASGGQLSFAAGEFQITLN